MKRSLSLLFLLIFSHSSFAQSTGPVNETFTGTRIVNAHSVELVQHKYLDVRITHRFGDVGGNFGGIHNLYGIDNVDDVRIAFEWGAARNFTVGAGRSKGALLREILDAYGKYRFLRQTEDDRIPVTAVALFTSSVSTMESSSDSASVSFFDKFAHRVSYVTQVIVARKFSEMLSIQLMPTYSFRNLVAFEDQNEIFAIGGGLRFRFAKHFAIIGDYYYLIPYNRKVNEIVFFNPASIGLEIKTGGHVFAINLTNSKGILPTEHIPYTSSDLTEGEYRIGFTISRPFKILK